MTEETLASNLHTIYCRERYHTIPEYKKQVIISTIKSRNKRELEEKIPWNKRPENHNKVKDICKKSNHKLKLEVLIHYSGNPPECKHCGNMDIRVLNIDHINNDGAKHRKEVGSLGTGFYSWLKRMKYPKDYQVLCFNCNWIKRLECM